jgi:CHASE2 domain-containing sensor protein/tRNA A-37 threonylcarbamoyl transferase component Bud32
MTDQGSQLFDETLIARRGLRKWVAVTVGLLVVIRFGADAVPFMHRPDLLLLDAWQSLRGTERPSPQVVIVAMDEKSIQRFGPPAWPRNEYVPLVERLSAAGAQVIGFDITFGTLEREAENNALLAAAMKKAGNVVFGYEFTNVGDPSPPGTPPSAVVQASALPRAESVALPPAPSLIEPEPVLAEAAAALGHVWAIEAEDGRIRALNLVIKHGDKVYPSLALQVARVYTETPPDELELTGGLLGMGAWDIPVSPSGEVLLDWPAKGENAFPMYSFLDVVRGDVPDEAFRGKAVLVAATAAGLDERDFPFAVAAPGVLTHATFLDNVFRVSFVQAPLWAWFVEWGLFLAFCGLGTAGFMYVEKGVWFKAVYPLVALVVPLGVVVVLRLTQSERETRDVAAEKLENQKLLGLSFQEKGMLDMALATFRKLPFTDEMKPIFVNLGLDYENRGQRDKAYLVYKTVFDVDPSFEDVAQRMERLSQAGASASLFAAPTAHVAAAPTPLEGTRGSPLAELVPTPMGPGPDEQPTAMKSGEQPTVLEEPGATLPPEPGSRQGETSIPTEMSPAPPPTQVVPPGAATPRPTGTPRPGTPRPVTPRPATPAPTTPAHITPAPGGPVMVGSRFGQRFEVVRHLGRGGMGDVYEVRDTRMGGRKAALKTIRPDKELDPKQVIEMRQRFYREANTAGALNHPNIVTVYDVGEELGMSYIVMEFVEGDTLANWTKKQRFSVSQIKHVIYNAGMGLDYAHENGIYHRDVKPDNIMVTKSGVVKVMDFGIARLAESDLTKTGSVMGTPAYMSPEQVNGMKIDARSDIFSLGVITYELLTGKRPFTGENIQTLMFSIIQPNPAKPPSTVDAKVSTAWDGILAKALAKNRDERYASAKEFAEAVKDAPAR